MKGIIKDSFVLFAITLFAGLLLGGVYYITKEPIEKQEQIAKDNACKNVFSEAAAFEKYNEINLERILDGSDYRDICQVDEIIIAKGEDGSILGYVIGVTSKKGYGGDISLMVGIDKKGTVKGIDFLSISETAGLGMNATKPAFYDQFSDKRVDSFIYVKDGANKSNEIDAISSATITTSAVTDAVNCSIAVFSVVNGKVGAGNE